MRVLLLEDDPFLQIDVADMVDTLGHEVIGPFAAQEAAIAAYREYAPDAAIIDFNLGDGKNSHDVAVLLRAAGVPFVFTTGYGRRHLPAQFSDARVIEKPYVQSDIAAFLDRISGSS